MVRRLLAVTALTGAALAVAAPPASACRPEYCPPPPPWCGGKHLQELCPPWS